MIPSISCSSLLRCLLVFAMLTVQSVSAVTLTNSKTKMPFIPAIEMVEVKQSAELVIQGINNTAQSQLLIVRIDDINSTNYRSRFNKEFTVRKGTFEVVMPLTGLKTSARNELTLPYKQLIIFSGNESADMALTHVSIRSAQSLPQDTMALDFGTKKSTLYSGFELIDKDHAFVSGKIRERVRTSGDALTKDGLTGVNTVEIPWKNGWWQLSLWTSDQGEWEYLPHFLQRKITANGMTLVDEQWTAQQWVSDVYLQGQQHEGGIDGNPWQTIGERRNGFISTEVEVDDGRLVIKLEGDHSARYLAGLVLEPIGGGFAKEVQQQQRERFLNQWPVVAPSYQAPDQLHIDDISAQVKNENSAYLAAQNSVLNLLFEIESPHNDASPLVVVATPQSWQGDQLDYQIRYGHWRYERPDPDASELRLSDSYLRSDMDTMRLSKQLPRRIHVEVSVPNDIATGTYESSLQLLTQGKVHQYPFSIEVLNTELPALEKSIGLYITPAPYYQWFEDYKQQTDQATECDLALLSKYGFTQAALSFVTPDSEATQQQFITQLQQLQNAGFHHPVLAYAPFKRLLNKHGNRAYEHLLNLQTLMARHENLPQVYWSIYDEPHPEHVSSIKTAAQQLKQAPLAQKSAGHMNKTSVDSLIAAPDLLIVNHAAKFFARNKKTSAHQQLWLYNMPNPRLAAGAYLWRTAADGYIQWHGRMPTADPFDPSDGREGDVIYIYPQSAHQCHAVANIHQRLLALHEATIDMRWLQWLDGAAQESTTAKNLRDRIQRSIPIQWSAAQKINTDQLLAWRKEIMQLAQQQE